MMRVHQKARRYDFEQRALDSSDVFPGRQTGAPGDPKDVRVNGDGGLVKGDIQDDIGGLSTDPGQGLERGALARNLPLMALDK